MRDFHVIVVGAGTAGCLAARDLARKGWRVGLFDAADEGRLHRPIIVDVERGAFAECDVPEPGPDLVPYHPDKVHFVTDSGRLIFTFDPHADGLPTSLHLDKFNALLLGQARDAGAQVHLGRPPRRGPDPRRRPRGGGAVLVVGGGARPAYDRRDRVRRNARPSPPSICEDRVSIRRPPRRHRREPPPRHRLPLAARLGVTLRRVLAHYAKFPRDWDPVTFDAWAQKKRCIFGALLPD